MSERRQPWWLPIAALVGAWSVRLLGLTWRFEVADAPEYTAAEAGGERFVYAFWHSAILAGAVSHRDRGVAVLVSRHHDGELIARIIHRLGFVTGRGSSTRGGGVGVRELLAWADLGRHLAITPDGPRGPAETAKDGVPYLASRTGRRVVPIAFGMRSAWRLRSWDRFRIPRPFARVLIAHGAPISLPSEEPARAQEQFATALTRLTHETRERAGEPVA